MFLLLPDSLKNNLALVEYFAVLASSHQSNHRDAYKHAAQYAIPSKVGKLLDYCKTIVYRLHCTTNGVKLELIVGIVEIRIVRLVTTEKLE